MPDVVERPFSAYTTTPMHNQVCPPYGKVVRGIVAEQPVVFSILATQHYRPTLSQPGGRSLTVPDTGRRQEEANRVTNFLTRLYKKSGKDEHLAVDEVFGFMDDSLLAGDFSVCERVFEQVDPNELAPSGVVSLLMVTQRAKEKIRSRSAFITRAEDAIARREGMEEAKALLEKYR